MDVLNRLIAKARLKLSRSRRIWANVHGPAAAAVATAARLGWTMVSTRTIEWDDGSSLDLACDPPVVIGDRVHDAVRRWQCRRISAAILGAGLVNRMTLEPIRKLVHGVGRPEGFIRQHRAALRSAACGGQWPQARLFAAGLADDPGCQLCKAHGPPGEPPPKGTLKHRLICPYLKLDGGGGDAEGRGADADSLDLHGDLEGRRDPFVPVVATTRRLALSRNTLRLSEILRQARNESEEFAG